MDRIYVDEQIKDYIVKLVYATRRPKEIDPKMAGLVATGCRPAPPFILRWLHVPMPSCRAPRLCHPGRCACIALDVMRHRILLTYEAEAEEVSTTQIVQWILDRVPVPMQRVSSFKNVSLKSHSFLKLKP